MPTLLEANQIINLRKRKSIIDVDKLKEDPVKTLEEFFAKKVDKKQPRKRASKRRKKK